jgi:pyruvate/2-oxoglutarate dehydrogenase complex dihydrolipoamide dehydrogenase (E3) component
VRLLQHATADSVLRFDPDAAIIATGSSPLGAASLPFGAGGKFVLADDVLRGEVEVRDPVFIVSRKGFGTETALLLAEEGHAVTLLEAGEDPAPYMPGGPRAFLLARLEELPVTILTGHRTLGLDAEGIIVETSDGKEKRFDDPGSVVLAIGRRGNDGLAGELEPTSLTMLVVGDAARPRHLQAALHEGALAGRDI